MIGRTNTGGGGAGGLNFRVIGGTSAPSNPKENDIWVNTDVKITGYIFSATEPESPTAGMVWVIVGMSSIVEFNALKKNGIQVYPSIAKQYVSGAWVDKTTKSYQGGEWVGWIVYLFQSGTGEKIAFTSQKEGYASVTTTNDSVKLVSTASSNAVAVWQTKEKYDVTNVREIVFVAKCSSILTTEPIFIPSFIATPYTMIGKYTSVTRSSNTQLAADNSKREYILNVENLNGSYYIGYVGIGVVEVYDVIAR